MSRKRFQMGTLIIRGKTPIYCGVFREDVMRADGVFKRVRRTVVLGLVSNLSEQEARRLLQPYIDHVNAFSGAVCKIGLRLNLQNKGPSLNSVFRQYVRSAKLDNRAFTLSLEQFLEVISQPCYYCGSTPNRHTERRFSDSKKFVYNGLDRVANAHGYSYDNVVACCKQCNYAKHAYTAQEFIAMCCRVVKRHPQPRIVGWQPQIQGDQRGNLRTQGLGVYDGAGQGTHAQELGAVSA